MGLTKRKLVEVAQSIRKRHFQSLLEEFRQARAAITSALRLRKRRVHLLRLARNYRLASCLAKLRSSGMILRVAQDQPPYITYDHRLTREHIQIQQEHCREIRAQWDRLKEESTAPVAANLKTLLQETDLLKDKPLRVRWVVDDITLNNVWIGDLEVTLGLETFSVQAWNISVDTADKHDYQHPHVASDGRICWNGHDEEARAFHASGDFLARKDMIENLLRTYNPRSPYITLEDWEDGYGAACGDCSDRYAEEDLSYSDQYGISLCPNCRYYCEECDDYVPEYHFNHKMQACERCVESGSDVCTLCLELFWKTNLTTIQMKFDGKLETVPCCENCKEEYEAEQENNEKEESENGPEPDDHTDGQRLLAPGVALSPHAQ